MTIPVFPLPHVVLMPGLVLPLYIFEPRYRALLARVQASGEPFGIVRIKVSSEQSALPLTERVALVGTLAHVRQVETHEDGTSSVTVVGGERFRIVEFDESRDYLSARIAPWPLQVGEDERVIQALAVRVRDGLLLARADERERVMANMPRDPALLATYASALLPLSPDQRQHALEAPSLEERLEALAGWLPGDARVLN